jgi:ABC-type arginine transport system ATPase subunit
MLSNRKNSELDDSCTEIRNNANRNTDTLILIGIMGKGKSTLGNVIFMNETDDSIPDETSNPELQVFKAKRSMVSCT